MVCPLVVYFDFEPFLLPVAGYDATALAVVDHHLNVSYFHHVDNSEDCMGNFVKKLHSLARDIHDSKKQFPFYNGNRRNLDKNSATYCWISKEPFDSELDPEESKDLDHCHFSGQFLGSADENCNSSETICQFYACGLS